METHTTRVSNTPWKLGVLETSQREFRQKTKKNVKYVPVTLKLAYETHVETWLRPRLNLKRVVLGILSYVIRTEAEYACKQNKRKTLLSLERERKGSVIASYC